MLDSKPLFSIGVTTYNRKDLLKQTLLSLLEQTFTDFEVIVGNDYTGEVLSAENLGMEDPRVRFVNNPRNIGELENMNSLLGMAHGKYFSWQFDDDPCAPTLLFEVYSALIKQDFPSCVFTSYLPIYGESIHRFRKNINGQLQLFPGRDFLRLYLSGRLKVLGCCGFYSTDYLKGMGGVQRLSNGPMALHSEYLLLIRAGLLSKIAYINVPLVTTRVHEKSWTCSNSDVELFKEAGINLIRESIVILSTSELKDDFQNNLTSILKSVLSSVIMKSTIQNKKLGMQEIRDYIYLIEKEIKLLKGSALYECAVSSLDTAHKNIYRYIIKAKLKTLTPFRYLKFAHMSLSIFSRYTGKAF
jgi:glycosyltransferase involved in cell wall biosynthesis